MARFNKQIEINLVLLVIILLNIDGVAQVLSEKSSRKLTDKIKNIKLLDTTRFEMEKTFKFKKKEKLVSKNGFQQINYEMSNGFVMIKYFVSTNGICNFALNDERLDEKTIKKHSYVTSYSFVFVKPILQNHFVDNLDGFQIISNQENSFKNYTNNLSGIHFEAYNGYISSIYRKPSKIKLNQYECLKPVYLSTYQTN